MHIFRELYPHLAEDLNRGKLFPVTTPESLSNYTIRKKQEMKRKSVEDRRSLQSMTESDLETQSLENISEKEDSTTVDQDTSRSVIRYYLYIIY